MRCSALKFLYIISSWILAVLLLLPFLFNDPENTFFQYYRWSMATLSYVQDLFRFSDDWNVVALTFLASGSVTILCFNDLLIGKLLSKAWYTERPSFWIGGFLWLVRTMLNGALFMLEVMLFCYVVNTAWSSPLIHPPARFKQGKYIVLLLGTSKYLKGGTAINHYYSERIDACLELQRNGVIRELIISGDGASGIYDETRDMREDLIKQGFHGIKVTLDPRGYRTFDSIKRLCRELDLTKDDTVLIVSQGFHLERALYLAKAEQVNARGVLAGGSMTAKMLARELLAKTRVLLDIYIFNTQTDGVIDAPRRQVDPGRALDLFLLAFVLSSVALAGRMMRLLVSY